MLMQTVKESILTKMDVIAIIISIAALAVSIYVAYSSTNYAEAEYECENNHGTSIYGSPSEAI